MHCVYYCLPSDADHLIQRGISHDKPQYPGDPSDTRYVHLYPLAAATCIGEWRKFAWRYRHSWLLQWAAVVVNIPPDEMVSLRSWGDRQVGNREVCQHEARGDEQQLLEDRPDYLELIDLLDDAVRHTTGLDLLGADCDRFMTDEIADYAISGVHGRLFVRTKSALQMAGELDAICGWLQKAFNDQSLGETERCFSGLECLNILFLGTIPSSWIVDIR